MKIVAMLEDFNREVDWYGDLIHRVREQSGVDYLIAVMAGDFLYTGRRNVCWVKTY